MYKVVEQACIVLFEVRSSSLLVKPEGSDDRLPGVAIPGLQMIVFS